MAGSPVSSHTHDDRVRATREAADGQPGDWFRCPKQLSAMALVVCTHRVLRVQVRECRGNKGMASGGHWTAARIEPQRQPATAPEMWTKGNRWWRELPTGHDHSGWHAGAGGRLMSSDCPDASAGWRARVTRGRRWRQEPPEMVPPTKDAHTHDTPSSGIAATHTGLCAVASRVVCVCVPDASRYTSRGALYKRMWQTRAYMNM